MYIAISFAFSSSDYYGLLNAASSYYVKSSNDKFYSTAILYIQLKL